MAPESEVVQPRFLWVPDHESSAGAEAAELAETCGMFLDGEQRMCLDAMLAEKPDGSWVAKECAVIASRQNLKTFLFQALVIAKLWLFDDRLVVWSAHLFPTTMEAFRDLTMRLESYDHLRKRVKRISNANGDEGIELFGDRRIQFKARTKSGGRGLTGDTVILDEALMLGAAEMGALLPTTVAKPNAQVFYGSSAGKVDSDILRGVRDRGRSGDDPGLAYLEWSAPRESCENDRCDHRPGTSTGCALDRVDLWRQSNPTLGKRITIESLEAQRRALPPEEFAREFLGWWEDPEESVDGIPVEVWAECLDAESKVDAAAFGVFPALDLSWAAIAAVGIRDDGRAHIEVIEYRPATDWVAVRCAELKTTHGVPIVVMPSGPRSSIGDDLAAAGVEVVEAKATDLMDGCGALLDRVLRRTAVHIGQPELDLSVAKGRRRMVGDGWTWALRASSIDISPLVAATLALWGAGQPSTTSVYEERGLVTL